VAVVLAVTVTVTGFATAMDNGNSQIQLEDGKLDERGFYDEMGGGDATAARNWR